MGNAYIESPQKISDKDGQEYARICQKNHKKKFGQYLTPVEVASFMGSLISNNEKSEITILDPGIGSGVLTCAVCENAITKIKN